VSPRGGCLANAHTRLGRGRRMIAPAQATVKPHDLSLAWLRKLDPFWTSSERTFEQCVSPSPTATAATGSCTLASRRRQSTAFSGKERASLEGTFQGGACPRAHDGATHPWLVYKRRVKGRGRMQSFDRQRRGNEADL